MLKSGRSSDSLLGFYNPAFLGMTLSAVAATFPEGRFHPELRGLRRRDAENPFGAHLQNWDTPS